MSDDAVGGFERHSYPLGSTTPTTEELRPFTDAAEDAAIVGLGEATHGTRELFELKRHLVAHLVADCGVRTVALETDFATTLALDEYVYAGAGTAADALDALVLWVWRAESILETVEWLRRFNEGRPPEDRVRLLGVSLSQPGESADRLRRWLRPVPEIPIPDRLDSLATESVPEDDAAREAFLDSGIAVAGRVRDQLDSHRAAVVDHHSTRVWRLVRRLCRHLEQNCEWNRLRLATEGFDPEAFEQRDRHMAETVGWCLETDPGDGVAVWAHNTHVKRGSFDMPQEWATGETMGEFVAREHGAAYRPYATDFARGRYRAVVDADDRRRETVSASVPPPETTARVLDAVETPAAFLDIESGAAAPGLASWLGQTREVRSAAALVDPDRDRQCLETDLGASFDGLFAVRETEPSVPL